MVLLPPSNDPFASDEEEGDDDIGLSGNINLLVDVSGIVKIILMALTTLMLVMKMVLMNHIRRQIRENVNMEPKIFDIKNMATLKKMILHSM